MSSFGSSANLTLVAAALDGAPFGIALVDETRRTVFVNAAMRAYASVGFVAIDGEEVQCSSVPAQRAFATSMDRVRGSTERVTFAISTACGVTQTTLLVNVEGVIPHGTIVRALRLGDVDEFDPAIFQATLAATPAEARIAALLACGRDIEEIGACLGIGRETIRTHVKRLLQKTGTRRQAELVRTLVRASMVYGRALTHSGDDAGVRKLVGSGVSR